MVEQKALTGESLVDVYLDGRLIATCPVGAGEASPAARSAAATPVSVALAKQMLREDGVMGGEALERAQFRVRRARPGGR